MQGVVFVARLLDVTTWGCIHPSNDAMLMTRGVSHAPVLGRAIGPLIVLRNISIENGRVPFEHPPDFHEEIPIRSLHVLPSFACGLITTLDRRQHQHIEGDFTFVRIKITLLG